MELFAFSTILRKQLIHIMDTLTIDELNRIPEGFSNNIAWHAGHLWVSTPILCYHKTLVDPAYDIPQIEAFKNGTVPLKKYVSEDILEIKHGLIDSLNPIKDDYKKGRFNQIKPYSTHTFGKQLNAITDVFTCCELHDAIHIGNVKSMLKTIKNN
jgi:hypothetical protein